MPRWVDFRSLEIDFLPLRVDFEPMGLKLGLSEYILEPPIVNFGVMFRFWPLKANFGQLAILFYLLT